MSRIRAQWPRVKIWLRADSGFARDALMTWCEANKVDYVFGLAKNSRLLKRLAPELVKARADHRARGQPARCFKDFTYRTRNSWSRRRRVIGKAEHLKKGPNPRFIVTSLKPSSAGHPHQKATDADRNLGADLQEPRANGAGGGLGEAGMA